MLALLNSSHGIHALWVFQSDIGGATYEDSFNAASFGVPDPQRLEVRSPDGQMLRVAVPAGSAGTGARLLGPSEGASILTNIMVHYLYYGRIFLIHVLGTGNY